MSFDLRPLLTFNFWFNTNPPPLLSFFENAFFLVYIFALIGAVLLGFWERKGAKGSSLQLIQKCRRLVTTFGVVGLLLSFFAYERTPVLSMRLFTALLWALALVRAVVIFYWRVRTAPVIEKSIAERKAFEKYLPK